jgi:hypothetical protein
MNIASVFDWFARESLRAAEQTHGNVRYSSNWRCYGKPLHGAKNNRRNQRRRTVTTGLRNLLLRGA